MESPTGDAIADQHVSTAPQPPSVQPAAGTSAQQPEVLAREGGAEQLPNPEPAEAVAEGVTAVPSTGAQQVQAEQQVEGSAAAAHAGSPVPTAADSGGKAVLEPEAPAAPAEPVAKQEAAAVPAKPAANQEAAATPTEPSAELDAAAPGAGDPAPAGLSGGPMQPDCIEHAHHKKPQWRLGQQQGNTRYLFVTMTSSDVNSRRLRPPRPWYDALLGGPVSNFVVHIETESGVEVFALQAHAYDYCKAEYYLQGGEVRRLFQSLAVQPGDGLLLHAPSATRSPSGAPVCKVELVRLAANPHAAAVMSAAASRDARRLVRTASKATASAQGQGTPGRKRKVAPKRADAGDHLGAYNEEAEAEGEEAEQQPDDGKRRRAAPRRFVDDFVTGATPASKAGKKGKAGPSGAHSSEPSDVDAELSISDDSRGASPLKAARAAARSKARGLAAQAHPGALPAALGLPSVVATGVGGRNVLRIRMPPRAPPGGLSTAVGGSGAMAADCLAMLAGVADEVRTPAAATPNGAAAAAVAMLPPPLVTHPVTLLSKSLLRGADGRVEGAKCQLVWDPAARTAAQVCSRISDFGLRHTQEGKIVVDEFSAVPAEHTVHVTLRLQEHGRPDVLEGAIRDLQML